MLTESVDGEIYELSARPALAKKHASSSSVQSIHRLCICSHIQHMHPKLRRLGRCPARSFCWLIGIFAVTPRNWTRRNADLAFPTNMAACVQTASGRTATCYTWAECVASSCCWKSIRRMDRFCKRPPSIRCCPVLSKVKASTCQDRQSQVNAPLTTWKR